MAEEGQGRSLSSMLSSEKGAWRGTVNVKFGNPPRLSRTERMIPELPWDEYTAAGAASVKLAKFNLYSQLHPASVL
jgi:hypothetical protein